MGTTIVLEVPYCIMVQETEKVKGISLCGELAKEVNVMPGNNATLYQEQDIQAAIDLEPPFSDGSAICHPMSGTWQ